MTRTRGFTLVELMVVVAIVGILAAVAYPSYIESVRSSRRAEAVAEIGRLSLLMERWRADRSSYAGSGAGYPAAVAANAPYYSISISVANATAYTILAEPTGSQSEDRCDDMSFAYSAGVVTKTPTTAGCWKK